MIDKSKYDKIDIPENLSFVVDEAIKTGMKKKKSSLNKAVKVIGLIAAVFCVVFVSLLNTNRTFALAMQDLPVVGDICKVFTFREYKIEDEINYIEVKVPNIEINGKNDLEKRVNMEIIRLIDYKVNEAKDRAKEYYDAFIATGGKPEDFFVVEINIDYEIKCQNEKYVSFVITKFETMASAYTEQYFYNIDLGTGRILNLKDWFGTDYKDIVVKSMEKTIANFDEDKKLYIFDDIDLYDVINEDTKFYINDKDQAVVVFDKYEIAAGAAGILEFPIDVN